MVQFPNVAEELEKHELEVILINNTIQLTFIHEQSFMISIQREQVEKNWQICTVNYFVCIFATLTCKGLF